MFSWNNTAALCRGVNCRLLWFVLLCGATIPPGVFETRARADDKPAAAPRKQPDFEEEWNAVYIGNVRVGYVRSSTTRKEQDGRKLIITDQEMAVSFSRLGQKSKMRATVQMTETAEGDLLEFTYELLNPPAATLRRTGRVEGDLLIVETETAGTKTPTEFPREQTVKSSGYRERQFREDPLKPGEKRTYKSYSPEFNAVSTTTLVAGKLENVKLLDGKARKLLGVKVSESVAPGIVSEEYIDESGKVLMTSTPILGLTQVTYKVSKDEALKSLSGDEIDLALASFIKTRAIDHPRETRRVVYRIKIAGEDPGASLTAGPTQKIARVDAHTIDLTVEAPSPPENGGSAGDDRPGKQFLEPNAYVQSDDALVRKLAAEAVGDESDPWKSAQLMERWVQKNVRKKHFSTLLASAAEVAKDLSGDCTEHAVLLAAMCRARRIPSRVAIGLVYAPDVSGFFGHMWTEVYIHGRWTPLDATVGKGHVAADHIKFADSAFAEGGESSPITAFVPMASVLGKMKIEVREVEHQK